MRRLFLCYGSESEGDKLAHEICDALRGKVRDAILVKCGNPFEIANHIKGRRDSEVVIVDVVKDLNKTRVFRGADAFHKTKSVTTHDLDLCTVLKLMEATQKTDFKIIGVPFGEKKENVLKDVQKFARTI